MCYTSPHFLNPINTMTDFIPNIDEDSDFAAEAPAAETLRLTVPIDLAGLRLDAALAFVRHEAHQGQFVQRGTVFDAEGV